MGFTERLARGVGASLLAQVVTVAANAALLLVLTRYLLDPAAFGRLQFALAAVGLGATVAGAGLSMSAARYVTAYAERDPGQVRHVIRRSLAALLAVVAVVAAGYVVAAGPAARWLDDPALAALFAAGGGFVVARALTRYCAVVFQGFNRVTWSAAVRSVAASGRFLFVVAFLLLGFGVLGALLGYVVGFAVAAAVGLAVLYRRFYLAYPEDAAADGLSGRVLRYSVPLTATEAANVLDKKVDTVIVGVLLNPTAVAFYALAKQISDFAVTPAVAFGFALSPNFGELKAGGETDRAARIYERALVGVLALYVPAAVGLVLVAGPAIRYVFGPAYAGAVPVVQVFAAFVLLTAVNKITNDTLDYLGRATARAWALGGSALANVALTWLAVPRFGVVGAAVVTDATYAFYVLASVYVVHREFGLRPRHLARRLGTVCAVAAAMGVAVWALLPYVSDLASLVGVVVAGIVVWGALAVLVGVVSGRRVRRFLSN